ncbi:MAG: o-succinylbenzoate---CoA ligase, partial [Thermoleophilaceae bacterium]|nr:o-succinylbenzoate---CoA ligase [Thermoleophilaceae bacterium]
MDPALIVDGAQFSHAEVREKAVVSARQLVALGAGAGDLVATTLPPGLDFVALLHAMPLIGTVLVPLNTREPQRPPGLDGALLVSEPLAGEEASVQLRADVDPAATWVRLHTSGTTAAPKPVELTYGNFRASAAAAASNLPVGPGDRWLCVLPLFHVGGLSILTRSAIYGSCAIVHQRFDADAVGESLESGETTIASVVATMLRRLQARGLAGAPALRAALVGGGPVPRDLVEWGEGVGLPILLTYGMTETCSQIATAAPGSGAGRVKPLPGVDLRIGAQGEILVRGPMVSPGALGDDGWLHTGDRGSLDQHGFLHVEGRIKDT